MLILRASIFLSFQSSHFPSLYHKLTWKWGIRELSVLSYPHIRNRNVSSTHNTWKITCINEKPHDYYLLLLLLLDYNSLSCPYPCSCHSSFNWGQLIESCLFVNVGLSMRLGTWVWNFYQFLIVNPFPESQSLWNQKRFVFDRERVV